jgi:ribonuclease P/MRP protein subunit POP5
VDGRAVLPRVVAVSGTIKKLQSAAIVHHRRNTAAAVASLVAQGK